MFVVTMVKRTKLRKVAAFLLPFALTQHPMPANIRPPPPIAAEAAVRAAQTMPKASPNLLRVQAAAERVTAEAAGHGHKPPVRASKPKPRLKRHIIESLERINKNPEIKNAVAVHSGRFGLDPVFVKSVIIKESGAKPKLRRGQLHGLMQVSDLTLRELRNRGIEITDTEDVSQNILAGCATLNLCLEQIRGKSFYEGGRMKPFGELGRSTQLALTYAAYRQGPHRVLVLKEGSVERIITDHEKRFLSICMLVEELQPG